MKDKTTRGIVIAVASVFGIVVLAFATNPSVLMRNNPEPDQTKPISIRRPGWINQRCDVFSDSDMQLPIGFLTRPAAVTVIDTGKNHHALESGPVKDIESGEYIEVDWGNVYIPAKAFTRWE